MTLPYGVISDPHYHKWDSFSTTDADGLNSRLAIQLEATKEAAIAMKKAGCSHMLVAGDTFHVRGTVSPTVLNYVSDAYEWIVKDLGLSVAMLAGKPLYPEIKDDPLVWMNKWLLSDTLQIAPQEAEQSTYLVGQIDSAVDRAGLSQFADL